MPRPATRSSQPLSQQSPPSKSQRSQPNYNEQTADPGDKMIKQVDQAASQLTLYVLHNMDNKKILRRTILQKHVAVKGVPWNKQFAEANIRLKEIYGCELVVCDDRSVKTPSFYVRKTTPHINISHHSENEQRKQVVTFLLMTIVFMSNRKCSVKHLLDLFKMLQIIDEEEQNDDYVKELLKELCGNRMLDVENDVVSWGPLADDLVDKMEILKFVSKVYGTRVQSWGELHANAVEQIELNRMDEEGETNETNGEDVDMEQAGPSQRIQKSQMF